MQCEFVLTEPHALQTEGIRRSRYTVVRLKQLARIAAKLTRDGWPVWATMTGLAFEPPGLTDFLDEQEVDPDGEEVTEMVAQLLAELGIYEAFKAHCGKSSDEMLNGTPGWMWN